MLDDLKTRSHGSPPSEGRQRRDRDTEKAPHIPSRKLIIRSIVAVLALVTVGVVYWLSTRSATDTSNTARPAPAAPQVTVSHPIQRQITEWNEYTGQFSAVDYVEIRARVSGYLTEVHFKDGQIVKTGDLLFVIDPRPYEAEMRQAEANLERDKAQLVRANLDLTRYAQLSGKGFAPRQQLDSARAAAEGAAATVKADEAALAQAKLNVEFTRITAPITGRISRREISIGNMVVGGSTSSSTLLTTITSLDPIYFYFDMSESDFLAYRRAVAAGLMKSDGDNAVPAAVKLSDEKDWTHEGRVDFLDNQIQRSSGTIRARAIFANPNLLITAGQFGRIRVPASAPHQAILIPDSAIVTDQSRKIVMTVKDDGTVEPRSIQPGPSYGGLRIVRDGLGPNDTIIIDGLMRVRPGVKVKPQLGKIEIAEHP